ncbi:MAG: DUF1489 domain-containing protein [Litorimonas sp.]
MTVHLQKLSVGTESISTLRDWQKHVAARRKSKGLSAHPQHVTRMSPKQKEALLDGGSIYWVIKGSILCRNEIFDLEDTHTNDGRKACAIVMKPKLIPVMPTPRRAFQGWRYLKVEDAPLDLEGPASGDNLPPHLRSQLVKLGAW